MRFIYQVRDDATRQELWVAMRATLFARSNGYCEHCGKLTRLEVAHKVAKPKVGRYHPDFDPDSAYALCASCHRKMDHRLGVLHARPTGYKHSEKTKRKIARSNRLVRASAEFRAAQSDRTRRQWDRQGRVHPIRACENCGAPFRATNKSRFCSAACHYAFRTGKPRSGY